MPAIFAKRALLPDGWHHDVRLVWEAGRFTAVETDAPIVAGDERHAIAVPGMPNLHSHAFQRGMAGLAEVRGSALDSFWSWREVMYRFALSITPDEVEAIAAEVYMEMLEAGFTRVGEFHYLHHAQDGRPYAAPAEMAARIAAAASASGIALTLLPVFYAHAGFGGTAPQAGQRRFVSDLDGYARLLDASRAAVMGLDGAVVGVAPHSLRAVTPEELAFLVGLSGNGPLHIHVAEQVREVEDCLAWSGARPVEWLLDHAPVDDRWCLVHATHMTPAETERLARSGATAGLCPITEANLGDGIFDVPAFAGHGGTFGIGSDSNVFVALAEELRQLEYSQRLARRARNVVVAGQGSTGRHLFERAGVGGARALGSPPSHLATGAPADVVTLDGHHPALAGRDGDAILDSWIFAADNRIVDCVFVNGRRCVAGGRHLSRGTLGPRFSRAMQRLATT